jgi:hypothetical protein
VTYFNWDFNPVDQNSAETTEKVIQVQEMSANQFASLETRRELYQLILRNDGFFTKINKDQSVENGLWNVNHEIPSIILISPTGNQNYRIIEGSYEYLQVELINPQEFIQTNLTKEEDPKLFSSIN